MGIATFLPSREQLELRSKAQLAALGLRSGISVPATAVITTLAELAQVHHRVPYPFFVGACSTAPPWPKISRRLRPRSQIRGGGACRSSSRPRCPAMR